MVKHIAWTHIENFHNVRRNVLKYMWLGDADNVHYRAKIKLHGTNAGVQINPCSPKAGGGVGVYAQTRKRLITPDYDHMNFAKWVAEHEEYFKRCFESATSEGVTCTVFGEWCGKGIQNGVAVSELPEKIFAVFGVRFTKENEDGEYSIDDIVYEPDDLAEFLKWDIPTPENLHILPWFGEAQKVCFFDKVSLATYAEALNRVVDEIDREDPWIKETFNVVGPGEGVVCYPIGMEDDYEKFSRFLFKAKGETHRVVKKKVPVSVDPLYAKNVNEFIDTYLTEARLLQGLHEVFGEDPPTMRGTADFLKWVGGDIKRESAATLEDSSIMWKHVAKTINGRAVQWLRKKVEEI